MKLQNDERGMILVVALPMAALLVGCLWYVLSVGDAILHRERLQDTADATAWQSAVLLARAMNAEVSLNLLSASLASLQTERSAEAIQIVRDTQLALRATAPLLAAGEASRNNTRLARELGAADGAIALSYAALPVSEQNALAVDARAPWLLTAASDARDTTQEDARLPLEPAADGVTLEISPRAQNGNAVLQTWSIARREHFDAQSADERGMSLVSPGHPIDITPKNAAFARAEFYFDCADQWARCATDAAWSPTWSARLRRFERPDGERDPARTRRVASAFMHASHALQRTFAAAHGGDVHGYLQALFAAPACGSSTCLH